MKPLSQTTDPRMVKALAHPLRVQIIDALEAGTASPRELAERIGAPLGNVSYHVRKLEALGVLTLVEEAPRRGVIEHFYRLDARPNVHLSRLPLELDEKGTKEAAAALEKLVERLQAIEKRSAERLESGESSGKSDSMAVLMLF